MKKSFFEFRISRRGVIVFWLLIISVFLGIYFFKPSLFYQMQQATYQNTPYVNTPHQ